MGRTSAGPPTAGPPVGGSGAVAVTSVVASVVISCANALGASINMVTTVAPNTQSSLVFTNFPPSLSLHKTLVSQDNKSYPLKQLGELPKFSST